MAALWSVRQAQAANFIQSVHASHSEQVLHSRRATVLSWLGWCRERGYDGPAVPALDQAAGGAELRDPGPPAHGDRRRAGAGRGRDPLLHRAAGDDIYEHGGFTVHFFGRDLVDALADGWPLEEIHAFEEGDLPRRLCRVTQTLHL